MQFPKPLLPAKLLGRRKRFFADIIFPDQEQRVAHCPNPGSMRGNAEPGAPVLLAERNNPQGKLPYRWIGVDPGIGAWVCVDTGLANSLVRTQLEKSQLAPFTNVELVQPEFTIGDSRLDFALWFQGQASPMFIEVKSISMRANGKHFEFPDSPTKRGKKHLELLGELVLSGYRAALVFVVGCSAAESVGIADSIDPEYGRMIRDVRDLGVEVYAFRYQLEDSGIFFCGPIEINWNWTAMEQSEWGVAFDK